MQQKENWYVVYTKPSQEFVAKAHLENQKFKVYLPLLSGYKKVKDEYKFITKPLFYRYLFISANSESREWGKVHSTRGCISLVKFGLILAQAPALLLEKLQQYEQELHKLSKNPEFEPGDKVRFIHGPLLDYEGIIYEKNNQKRIYVLLNLCEEFTKIVNASIHDVEKLSLINF